MLINRYVPLRRLSNKRSENGQRVPWITKGILTSRKTKNILYKKFMKNLHEKMSQFIKNTEINSTK